MADRPPSANSFHRFVRNTFLALAIMGLPQVVSAETDPVVSPHFRFYFHDHSDTKQVEQLVRDAERLADRIESFTGRPVGDVVSCHTYATFESKGLATGYMRKAHAFSGRSEIHVALEDGFNGAFEHELAVVLLRRALGKPQLDSLEQKVALASYPLNFIWLY